MKYQHTNPFRFRGPVSEDLMVGREKEKKLLLGIVKNSQSAVLYAPRRFGKTWLLEIVAKESAKQKIASVYFDLFPVSSTIHFIESYATAIIKTFAKTNKSAQEFCKNYLSFLNPQITLTKDIWLVTYNWERSDNAVKRVLSLALALPEQIAIKENIKVAVIFDEFQEINRLNGKDWEREMRTVFQHQKKVGYIFSGSKTHIIVNMFTDNRRPFYQSAAMISLSEILNDQWKEFISRKFKSSNIYLDDNAVNQILSVTGGHPYYTQLLCYFIWETGHDKDKIVLSDVIRGVDDALENEDAYFSQLWDELSLIQKQLLIAIAKEGGKHIFSGDFMISNLLGPASSIRLSAMALTLQKGILNKIKNEYKFTDSFFKLWIRREIVGVVD